MTTCRKCGVMHGMGILDTITNIHTPIDHCYDCLWENGYTHKPITEQIVIDEHADYGQLLREVQVNLIRQMLISSASTPVVPDILPQEPVVD